MYDNTYMYAVERSDEYLAHYGIPGMKWGVRKAIERGNSKALGRQYAKAQKKLAKLEKRAANANKYKKRAVRYAVGAAAAGGLAAAGTSGIGKLVNKTGALTRNAMIGGGNAMRDVGSGISRFGAKVGNKKLQALGGGMASTGLKAKAIAGKTGVDVSRAGDAIQRWGNSKSIGRSIQNEAGKFAGNTFKGKNAMFNAASRDAARNATSGIAGLSNNTIARLGAGAIGAGLAAASAKNAYRAATAQKKAAKFRSAMNTAFKGTQYANGGAKVAKVASNKKKARHRG